MAPHLGTKPLKPPCGFSYPSSLSAFASRLLWAVDLRVYPADSPAWPLVPPDPLPASGKGVNILRRGHMLSCYVHPPITSCVGRFSSCALEQLTQPRRGRRALNNVAQCWGRCSAFGMSVDDGLSPKVPVTSRCSPPRVCALRLVSGRGPWEGRSPLLGEWSRDTSPGLQSEQRHLSLLFPKTEFCGHLGGPACCMPAESEGCVGGSSSLLSPR